MSHIDDQLNDFAAMLGLTVTFTEDLPEDRDGDFDAETNEIRLRPGMHARHHRSVFAHELAHAAFRDVPSKFGPVNAKQERRADEWAALRLINLDAYRHAERVHDGHAGAMAIELGVMRTIVIAYRGLLARLGDTVYVDASLGRNQWADRVETDEEL